MCFSTISRASASRPWRSNQRGDSGRPIRSPSTMRAGITEVAKMTFHDTPDHSSAYPNRTAIRKPMRQHSSRKASFDPRSRAGTNSESIGAPIEYSAPMAIPKRNLRIPRETPPIAKACPTPITMKAIMSTRNILRRPNLSVRKPKSGAPMKMPSRLAAPTSPSIAGVSSRS